MQTAITDIEMITFTVRIEYLMKIVAVAAFGVLRGFQFFIIQVDCLGVMIAFPFLVLVLAFVQLVQFILMADTFLLFILAAAPRLWRDGCRSTRARIQIQVRK